MLIKDIKSLIVAPDTPLKICVERLEINDIKVLLVVDAQNKLLGTLTDGDIRRGMLREVTLVAPVVDVMNKNAVTAGSENEANNVYSEHVKYIPIVARGAVEAIYTKLQQHTAKPKNNTVVLMAGGFGKRLYPLTKDCPKPMLEVGGKPFLEHTIESIKSQGFCDFIITTHYLPEIIKDYFKDGSRLGVNIRYANEVFPMGTGGSLSLIKVLKNVSPIILMNGDVLTDLNFSNLLAEHCSSNNDITMCTRQHEIQIPYGIIQHEDNRVLGLKEKPTLYNQVNTGIYVISADALKDCPDGQAFDLPDYIEARLDVGHQIGMYRHNGYWLDIGRVDDFSQAQLDITALNS
jgi:dTDP-glucose pyrophosphorylase